VLVKRALTAAMGAVLCAGMLAVPAVATPESASAAPPAGAGGGDRSTVDPAVRDKVLPSGWRSSTDVAWTTDGDPTGLHVLVAEARTGYTWRTAATLAEPGIETDRWVGNACLTASGRRAVVVYAPRHFTNRAHLFDRGAFTAVVDLVTGAVTKLDLTVSLAYYNPGCGLGETAVLTQSGVVDMGRTRLHTMDATRGRIIRSHEMAGEVTSAVPVGDHIVAASGARLVEIDKAGAAHQLAPTNGLPYRVHPDAEGGVVFTERHGSTGIVKRLAGKHVRELARGPLTGVRTIPGTNGRLFLTGAPASVQALPAPVSRLTAPVNAEVSTGGELTLTHVAPAPGSAPPSTTSRRAGHRSAPPVSLRATVTVTGESLSFAVDPAGRVGQHAAQGRSTSPALTGTARTGARTAAESSTDPVDHDRSCSIPRNDVGIQVYQPHWSQVEWAADLAVRGLLTIQRPADWKHSGMPAAWSPQQMFPSVNLTGGGHVPAQILLGVLAQESNLWQASFHVAEGVTGNPLIGNYYGVRDGWGIDWADADCGYGVAQVTDGMRMAGRTKPDETVLTPEKQRAVAVDYATNIAAGVRILQQKWNQTHLLGAHVNGANPARIESWFAALWAYNSGINPQAITGNTTGCTPSPTCTDADGNYGLGWTNNPARPDFPVDRKAFLDRDAYEDARTPQWWPYPEKVIGWAAYPIVKATGGDGFEAGYAQAWWLDPATRTGAKPDLDTFCRTDPNNGNRCDPGNIATSSNPCTRSDFHCWWHSPAQWKDCSVANSPGDPCGREADVLTAPGTPEPPDADASGAYADESRSRYRPNCSLSGLPAEALVIDNQPDSVPVVRPGCARSWTNQGTFGLSFAAHTDGLYHSKVDSHQIGGGFGGHFWFTHTRSPGDSLSRSWTVMGKWTLNRTLNQWARVLVHMPDHGAHSQQADYTIGLGNGEIRKRVVMQKTERHQWVSLGAFRFAGTPSVLLDNTTGDGDGSQDIAFDAVAFQPLAGKPADQIVVLGDSYTSGEGASTSGGGDYYRETDDSGFGGSDYRNGCHRSRHAWSRQAVLPGSSESIGSRADRHDPKMDYHLLACSGAQTEHLLPTGATNAFGEHGRGQFRELSQLERGFLDTDTTIVALTIGGNDARFSEVMRMCTLDTPSPLQFCQFSQVSDDWLGTDPPTAGQLDGILPMLIKGKVKDSIGIALRAIHEQAPNAKIVLAGYPRLFPPFGHRNGDCMITLGLNWLEIDFLNDMADLLNDVLHQTAVTLSHTGIPVSYSDPRDEFELGTMCSALNADDETIHRMVLDKTEGDAPGAIISQQTFHPKIAGAANYAQAFVNTLRRRIDGQGMPAPPSKQVAAAELDELRDNPSGSADGYTDGAFGDWTTVDGSCDGRNTVLRRDGTNLTPASGCPVTGGRWTSPYDNVVITTSTAPGGAVHIDHLVAKKEAWRSGADRWTQEQRRTFANDLEHPQLLAVSPSSNTSKQDRPPDAWLPTVSSYRCTYARAWIHTKHIYHLAITGAEYDTLAGILDNIC
jgi:hypothetical protein